MANKIEYPSSTVGGVLGILPNWGVSTTFQLPMYMCLVNGCSITTVDDQFARSGLLNQPA